MIKRGKGAILFILLMFLIGNVGAEILIKQTEPIYNVGDKFDVSIVLLSQSERNEFVNADLICSNTEVDLLKSPYFVEAGVQKDIPLTTKLSQSLIGNARGDCYLDVRFGDEEAKSQKFEISDDVDVTFELGNLLLNPGDNVNVKGKAKKVNGKPLNGFLEAEVEEIDFKVSGLVNAGEFNFNFTIPQKASSGTYKIQAKAYEKNEKNEIINQGTAESTIKVKQIMKEIGIALNTQAIKPSNELKYTVLISDQADENVEADVGVVIYGPNDFVLDKNVVRTGQAQSILIGNNYAPGEWRIDAKLDGLEMVKSFLVEEYENASFELENQTLIITNVGNVPYSGPVKISIGTINEIKEIENLPIGESKKFKLLAPAGSYKISIDDGLIKQELGEVSLIGKAVSVNDFSNVVSENWLVWIWVILIIAIAITVFVLYRRVSKEKILAGGKFSFKEFFASLFKRKGKPADLTASTSKSFAEADSANINKGERQEANVVVLKVKNLNVLQESHPEGVKLIDSLLSKAKEGGAKVYSDENHRIVVLTPALTREKDNNLRSLHMAEGMARRLREHNRRYSLKIEFGIGVSGGSLIVESSGDKFKFISVDNTITSAKKISEIASGEVLMTETVHRSVVGKIKTSKIQDKNLWKIEKINDRAEHEEFISKFKQRQKIR
ncbi:MAG: hypothetical protein AABY05_02110 [Nanoarchaeota archaeon]